MSIYQEIRVYSSQKPTVALDRLDYLASCCADKKTLHVGCADAPLSIERIRKGQLLQQRIEQVTSDVFGFDINEESIRLLRENGITSVEIMDAEKLSLNTKYETILAGDVLEHLSNPGLFLEKVPELLEINGQLVIAVPNAFTLLAVKVWVFGVESVHKDHCFYYSPKCLAQLCARYGLLPTKLTYTVQPRVEKESKIYCTLRDTIVRLCPPTSPAFIMHFQNEYDVNKEDFFKLR